MIDIKEGRDAPLYHYTDLGFAYKIVKSNLLKSASALKLTTHDGIRRAFISFTRDKHGAPDVDKEIRFMFDQRKLAYNYKIIPRADVDYRYGKKRHEFEEVIFTDQIDLKKYCVEVEFFGYDERLLQLIKQAIIDLEDTKGKPQIGLGGIKKEAYVAEMKFIEEVTKAKLPVGRKLKSLCDLYNKYKHFID